MSPSQPAHVLGPQVVGQRVVVRRVLPGQTGPSGGPAMTDVLGICTTWTGGADGHCVVQPETGPAVTIALTDIVSGKPVPPRPSPRLRISPDAAQRRAMSLFPQLRTAPMGGWTLRHCDTHDARRANSVLAMQPSGLADEVAYAEVVSWYAALELRPIAAVLPDTAAEQVFVDRGWVAESGDADTVFQLASVAAVARTLRSTAHDVVLEGDDTLVTATVAGAASGVAALADDWVGFRSIVVDAAQRRRGLGRAVMAALVGWAAERGATTAYLQVLGDNDAALALYAGLGFVEHHRYRYLAPPLR